MPKTNRILILTSAEDPEHMQLNDDFVAALNQNMPEGPSIEWCNYHDIVYKFTTDLFKVSRLSSGEDLSSYDFVYVKSYFRYVEEAASIAAYLQDNKIPFVCAELKDYIPQTKLTQFVRMAQRGLPIIRTIHLHHSKYLDRYDDISRELHSPFIFKCTDGGGGVRNHLIHSREELESALATSPGLPFVAQEFVENDSDLRVLIVGGAIELIIRRKRTTDSHMNNTSQGASAELVNITDLPESEQQLVLQAAKIMQRETAGVDLMYEKSTQKPYILEVNASPQIGSGAFMEEKLSIFCNYFNNVLK